MTWRRKEEFSKSKAFINEAAVFSPHNCYTDVGNDMRMDCTLLNMIIHG